MDETAEMVPVNIRDTFGKLPLAVVLVCWAGCAVLSALELPGEHDGCADEALPLVVDYNRADWALHEAQQKAAPAERARIADERKALLERMREEVGEIYRRHGREWRQ
jgi:hypothetical protein